MKKIESILFEIIELFIALVGILGVGVYILLSVSTYTSLSSYNSPSIAEHRQLFIFMLFVSIICLILSIRLVLRIWEEHRSVRFCMGVVSLMATGVILIFIYFISSGILHSIQEGLFPGGILTLILALVVGGLAGLNGWYEIKSKNNVRLEAAFSLISAVLICAAWFVIGLASIV